MEPAQGIRRIAGIRTPPQFFLYYCGLGASVDDSLQSGPAASPVADTDKRLGKSAALGACGIRSISGMASCSGRGITHVSATAGLASHCLIALCTAAAGTVPFLLADVHALEATGPRVVDHASDDAESFGMMGRR